MGKIHFSKLLIFALIITVSFTYVPQTQAGGVASAVGNFITDTVKAINSAINTVIAYTEIVIGMIPGLGVVGDDGRCRLQNTDGSVLRTYIDECGGGGPSNSVGSGGTYTTCQGNACVSVSGTGTNQCNSNIDCGGGPGGGGGGGYCGDNNCNNGETCSSCPADCGQCLPIQTISVCSGVFCSGSASCDPNVQSCSNQCGSKYDCGYVDPQVIIQPMGEVEVPDPLRVSWYSSYTSSCNASSNPSVWNGSKSTSGLDYIFNPTSVSNRGTYSFTLSCSSVFGDGASASDTKTARVISLPRCDFTADPSTIVLPGESTLAWNCAYASGGCSIDNKVGNVNPVSGSVNVVPSQTTTYTLNCNGWDGSRSWQATVTNAFEPIIKEVIPR